MRDGAEIVGWDKDRVKEIKRRYVAREKVEQARIFRLNKDRT